MKACLISDTAALSAPKALGNETQSENEDEDELDEFTSEDEEYTSSSSGEEGETTKWPKKEQKMVPI